MPSKRQRQPKPKSTRQSTKSDLVALENKESDLGSGLENVGFVLDLFLDQGGRVRLTQVLHVKSNEGEAWDCWDERRLIDFIVQRAELALPEAEPEREPPAPKATRAGRFINGFGDRTASPKETPKIQGGEFISHEVGIVPAHTRTRSRLLKRRESFDVQLFFGQENLFGAGMDKLNYNASISAHTWGGLSTYFLAIDHGVIKPTDSAITVSIPKQNLEPGVYCIQADLTVTSPEENEQPASVVSLTLKSGMLQVF
jgi:hypothetical protein